MTQVGGHVEEDIFDELSSHWQSAQVVEITAVIALFNYFNRFANALEVPPTR
jgi:alkylhydroperoxidase family enzyme